MKSERYPHIFKGIFYGSGCYRPFLVPVPVRDGVRGSPTLDDIDVNYWVKQHELRDCTASRRKLRRSFDTVPNVGTHLRGTYTLYFETTDQHQSVNHLLKHMSAMSGQHKQLYGSVLVIKQERTDCIVDCDKDDQLIVNFLIAR